MINRLLNLNDKLREVANKLYLEHSDFFTQKIRLIKTIICRLFEYSNFKLHDDLIVSVVV